MGEVDAGWTVMHAALVYERVSANWGEPDRLVEAMARPRTRDRARAYLIEAAPGRTERFGRHLQDPDPAVRAALVNILGLSDDPAAIALVQPLGAAQSSVSLMPTRTFVERKYIRDVPCQIEPIDQLRSHFGDERRRRRRIASFCHDDCF